MSGIDLEAVLAEAPPEPRALTLLAPSLVRAVMADAAENVEAFREFLRAYPPAIEGEGGDRHTMLVGIYAHDHGLSFERATEVALEFWNATCVDPWDETELLKKIESGFRSARGIFGNGLPGQRARSYPLTDLGNAERFVALWRPEVCWVPERGLWRVWDRTCWADDVGGAGVMSRSRKTIRGMLADAAQIDSREERDALVAHARASESKHRVEGMLFFVRSMLSVSINAFDTNPDLFNLQNGTKDLRTGELRPHDPADLITRLAPVAYDPYATCPVWLAFLIRVLPSPSVRRFLQKFIGYSMTGHVTEHVLAFLYGQGANGKSTFVTTLQRLMGTYARQMPGELLLSRSNGQSHPSELTALLGVRFAACSEIEERRRFDEPRVKALTGGDKVSARYLYAELFEFWPTAKLCIAGNSKPEVTGQDEGIWRRFALVYFDQTIPPGERDQQLAAKLAKELPGILSWAFEGTRLWREEGLQPPEEIRFATEKYRADEDFVAAFVDECCERASEAWVSSADLHRAYTQWAKTGEGLHLKQKKLGDRIRKLGFDDAKKKAGRGWAGLRLLPVPLGGGRMDGSNVHFPKPSLETSHEKTLVKTPLDPSIRPLAAPDSRPVEEEYE